MSAEQSQFSHGFQKLYCNATVFDLFSALHPISFKRVLPFQAEDATMDDPNLLLAEEAHLANRNDDTRKRVVEAYLDCGLLPDAEAANLKSVIDYFDADFFELMGLVYANAGMFVCALRWYRELIAELEIQSPNSCSDNESVYASVGYCLYSLGLFAEAISWSKSCIGSRQTADAFCSALIGYEAQLAGGMIREVERCGPRVRYIASALEPASAGQSNPRLKAAMNAFAPFQEVYIEWITHDSPAPAIQSDGYPFKAELDVGELLRHKMNLIFAASAQADALIERGYIVEAKHLLSDAAMVEPQASFIWERIKSLP